MNDDNDIMELMDIQIKNQGISIFTVKDGQVFKSTDTILRQLLMAAESNPDKIATVFVKSQIPC